MRDPTATVMKDEQGRPFIVVREYVLRIPERMSPNIVDQVLTVMPANKRRKDNMAMKPSSHILWQPRRSPKSCEPP